MICHFSSTCQFMIPPRCMKPTAAYGPSRRSATYLKESTIDPRLNTWAQTNHRWAICHSDWQARESIPSLPPISWTPCLGWVWHYWDSKSQWPNNLTNTFLLCHLKALEWLTCNFVQDTCKIETPFSFFIAACIFSTIYHSESLTFPKPPPPPPHTHTSLHTAFNILCDQYLMVCI